MKSTDSLTHLQGPLAATIRVEKEDYLYFGGTAYLGIPQNKTFLTHYIKGLERFGLNNGTSRSNNVQLGIYDEAEAYAAEYFNAQASLITSSGYLAAQLAVQYVSGLGRVVYAPGTHPALWLNGDPAVGGSFTAWAEQLVQEINENVESVESVENVERTSWVLISNSMNNLFPEIYDFSFLNALKPGKKIVLLIDDSHGIGVLNGGSGARRDVPGAEVIYVSSMAKGPGVDAGIILGSHTHISALKQMPHFPGASPPAAAGLYAFMESAEIYRSELAKLQELQDYLMQQQIVEDHFEYIPEFPVFLHRDHELAERLQSLHILISAFPYPDARGTRLNRIVLSSWHTALQLDVLLKGLAKAVRA